MRASRLLAVLQLLAGASGCTALFPFEAQESVTGDRCVAGRFPGRVDDVAVEGDYAFVASIDEVLVFDVSAPADVREVDSFLLRDGADGVGHATAIAADGDTVLVGTDEGAAILLRAGDPENLTRAGLIGPLGGELTDLVVADPFAFATRRQEDGSELHAIDLQAVELSDGLELDGQAFGLAMSEAAAVVALGAAGILLLEDPTFREPGTVLETSGSAKRVAPVQAGWLVAASTALVLLRAPDWDEGALLDRTRPGLENAEFQDIVVDGDRAVAAAGEAGAVVLDTKALRQGAAFRLVPAASPALRVAIDADRAYVACGTEGLVIVDLDCLGE